MASAGHSAPAAWLREQASMSRISRSLPVMSRRTSSWGWITRWIARSWRDSSLVTESTRKDMSSVTTSTTVWPDDQPFSSTLGVCTRTSAVPCGRLSPRR